ncbi:hypothetical protein ACIQRW_28760 [Streptomyces sp. NPDC091287]
MAAEEIPEVSPELAAARYLARQEVALQNPSTAEPDTAPTQGDDASTTTC